jgi:hypothetical protein
MASLKQAMRELVASQNPPTSSHQSHSIQFRQPVSPDPSKPDPDDGSIDGSLFGERSRAHSNRDKLDFKAKDLGYFDPKDSGPLVEVKDKVQIYYNVYSFTNRLRVKAQFIDPRAMKERLDECLLGSADAWYNQELNHLQRLGLRAGNGIEEWCKALEARFKQPPGQSLRSLEALQYTVADVYDRKDPLDFIQKVVIHGLNSGIASTENQQVLLAYNHLDVRLRMTLVEPNEHTTLSAFVNQIN